MIKGIIFDFDGTLFTSNSLGVKTLKNLGKKIDFKFKKNEYDKLRGLNRQQKAKILFKNNFDEYWPKWKKIYENNFLKEVKEFNNVINTLNLLKKEYKLFIFSTKDTELITKTIKKFKINKLFLEVYGFTNLNYPKPHPFAIKEIKNKYSLKNKELVMVGDSIVDLESAKNAKISFIYANYNKKNEFKNCLEFKNFKNLIKILK